MNLVRDHTMAGGIECVKSASGSDRDFDCAALREDGGEVRLQVTVGESGSTTVLKHCEPIKGSGLRQLGQPCEGIG